MENRDYTVAELRALGFSMTDSMTNFVFAKHEKVGGKEIYLRLREKGILVRHFDAGRIKDYNRITIGSLDEMKALISALREILEEYI